MSTFLANRCIGLGLEGYGALLGEVSFTISRVSCALDRLEFPTSHSALWTDDKTHRFSCQLTGLPWLPRRAATFVFP